MKKFNKVTFFKFSLIFFLMLISISGKSQGTQFTMNIASVTAIANTMDVQLIFSQFLSSLNFAMSLRRYSVISMLLKYGAKIDNLNSQGQNLNIYYYFIKTNN